MYQICADSDNLSISEITHKLWICANLNKYSLSRLAHKSNVGIALDPVELKLAPRRYATAALGGVFGALRDASPDYRGRWVIQRRLGKAQPGEMEYPLCSPDDRAGAHCI